MVVVVDHFRDRQPVGFIAETVGIKIFGHRVGIQRGAVGEGDAWTQRKGVFGFVGVRYPALCNPRFNRQRLRVLPG